MNISLPRKRQKKWGISERRVQKLCEEGRIPGVARISRMWLIPKDAKSPLIGGEKNNRCQFRRKEGNLMINIAICDDEVYMLNLLTEKVLGFFKQENMEIAVFPFQSGKALLDCDKKLVLFF